MVITTNCGSISSELQSSILQTHRRLPKRGGCLKIVSRWNSSTIRARLLAFKYEAILANIDSPECILKGCGHKCAAKRGYNYNVLFPLPSNPLPPLTGDLRGGGEAPKTPRIFDMGSIKVPRFLFWKVEHPLNFSLG